MLLSHPYSGIRFNPLLTPFKKLWNSSTPTYATFWDPIPLLKRLADTTVAILLQVRDGLPLCLRLLCLMRSVDCSRILRAVSIVNSAPFVLIKRKGQKRFQWEQLVIFPQFHSLCPWNLMQKYVEMTSQQAPQGDPSLFK